MQTIRLLKINTLSKIERNVVSNLSTLIILLVFSIFSSGIQAMNNLNTVVPDADGFLVKFRSDASNTSQLHALSSAGLNKVEDYPLTPGLSLVKTVAGQTLLSTYDAIVSNPNVEYVEPNYYLTVDQLPNDLFFDMQYGLRNTGQTGGIEGADIDAEKAWDIHTGNGQVIVAVVDTGVDYLHEDIRNNMWINPGEIPANGIDDDGNGFIDDIYGWDFNNRDSDPMDDMGHGTHVAGIIAAEGNNNLGVTGVNWNAKIMALKFADSSGMGTTSNAIKAINYAVQMGVRISNNSWGGAAFSQALYETILSAAQIDHLFVAAAGNEGENSDDPAIKPHYPSSYDLDNVISIAASGEFDELLPFSNYGARSVDIAAPGNLIHSLWINNSYISIGGTSMAAPYAAGVASLLLSMNPGLSAVQMKEAMMNTADVMPNLQGFMVAGGRLNAYRALSGIAQNIVISPSIHHISLGNVIQFSTTGGTPPYSWESSDPAIASINAVSGSLRAEALGEFQLRVTDANGASMLSETIFVENLRILPEQSALFIGETLLFSTTGGLPPFVWEVNNSVVASINAQTGLLRALQTGNVRVSVTDANNIKKSSGVISLKSPEPLVLLNQPLGDMVVGELFTFFATGGVQPLRWSSSDSSVIEIDASLGDVRVLKTGQAFITVRDAMGNQVSSNPITVSQIELLFDKNLMQINETQQFLLNGGMPPIEWRVSNSQIASIDSGGNMRALGQGSIRVTAWDNRGIVITSDIISISNSAQFSVVTNNTLYSKNEIISLNVMGGSPPYLVETSNASIIQTSANTSTAIAVGTGFAILSVTDSQGSLAMTESLEVREVTINSLLSEYQQGDAITLSANGGLPPYSWHSDNPSVLSIDSQGLLLAQGVGLANIKVTDSDGIASVTKTVTVSIAPDINHIFEISPNTAVFSRRSSAKLQFIAIGGVLPYKFSLSNPDIGHIDPGTGEYTPLSDVAGETTILVVDADGHQIESGIISVQ